MELIHETKSNLHHYTVSYDAVSKTIYYMYSGAVMIDELIELIRKGNTYMETHPTLIIFQDMSTLKGTFTNAKFMKFGKEECVPCWERLKIKFNVITGVKDPFVRFAMNSIIKFIGRQSYEQEVFKTPEDGKKWLAKKLNQVKV